MNGADLLAAYRGSPDRLITGRYYEAPSTNLGTVIPAEGQGFFVPIPQPVGFRIDDLTIEVTTVGTAGAVIRLGILDQGTDGQPDEVLRDAGTVDGTVLGFGTLAALVDAPVQRRLVFLASVVQGAAITRPVVRTMTGIALGPGGTTLTAELNVARGLLVTSLAAISGPLPAHPALSVSGGNFAPRVFMRGTQQW